MKDLFDLHGIDPAAPAATPDLFDTHGIEPPAPKPSGLVRRALGDTAVSLGKGVVGAGESLVGLADLATGGYAGKTLNKLTGYDPKATKAVLDDLNSPEQKAANKAVQEAVGFMPTIAALAKNPSAIVQSVIESAPSMLAAGGGAQLLGKAGILAKNALARGAISEGLFGAGQQAEQFRQDNPDGTLSARQELASLGSGAGTAAFAGIGGKVAQKLGIADLDTVLAGGKVPTAAAKQGLARRIGEGFVSEGALEEMPQSVWEQMAQNFGNAKPLTEGVGNAAATGLVVGGVMGGGMGAASRSMSGAEKPANQPAPSQPTDAPIPYTPTTVAEVAQQRNEAMGIDPAAGPLSAVASMAVESQTAEEIRLSTPQILAEGAQAAQQAQAERAAWEAANPGIPYEPVPPAPKNGIYVGKTALFDGFGASTGSVSDGNRRQLMVDPSGGYFWGDWRQESQRDVGAVAGGSDKDGVPASFQSGKEAREAAISTPASKTAPTSAGSFGAMNDFADLLGQERQDVTQRRAGIAERQGQRRAFDLAEADRRTAESMQREAQARRRAVLDAVLADPETKNPAGRFVATLRREGYRDTSLTSREAEVIKRHSEISDAFRQWTAGPTDAFRRMADAEELASLVGQERADVEQRREAMRRPAERPAPQPKDKVQQALSLIASGGTLQGRNIVSPTGKVLMKNLNIQQYQSIRQKLKSDAQAAPAQAQQVPGAAPNIAAQAPKIPAASPNIPQEAPDGATRPDPAGLAAGRDPQGSLDARGVVDHGADGGSRAAGAENGNTAAKPSAGVPGAGAGVKVRPKNLLQLVRQAGGVSLNRKADVTGDRNSRETVGVFRSGGMDLDGLAELLHQNGFLTDADIQDQSGADKASELLREALKGNRPLNMADNEAAMSDAEEAQYRDNVRRRADALGIKWRFRKIEDIEADVTAEEERASLDENSSAYDIERVSGSVQDVLDEFDSFYETTPLRGEAAMRAMGFTEEEIREAIQSAGAEAKDRGAEPRGQEASGKADSGQDRAGENFLESYSEKDLAARAEAQRLSDERKANEERRLEEKAQADAARDTFTPTGSDRPADVLATQGQAGLFDQPAPARNQEPVKNETRANAGPAAGAAYSAQESIKNPASATPSVGEAPSQLEALFSDLNSTSTRKANKARKAAAKLPEAARIEYVQANFHDLLIQLMDSGSLEVNGTTTLTEDNASCL